MLRIDRFPTRINRKARDLLRPFLSSALIMSFVFFNLEMIPWNIDDLRCSLRLKKMNAVRSSNAVEKLKKRGLVEELTRGPVPSFRQSPRAPSPSGNSQARRCANLDEFFQHKARFHATKILKGLPRPPSRRLRLALFRMWLITPNIDGDIFIPRDFVEDAMHGDTVIARIRR